MIYDADPITALTRIGSLSDSEIPLGEAALWLALCDHTGVSIEPYHRHLQKMAAALGEKLADMRMGAAHHDAVDVLGAINAIMINQEGYRGDTQTYDALENADMIRVIDRRRGLPVALAIIAIEIGRANGLMVDGLAFPGHFLCRLEHGGTRIIFDPFDQGRVMAAPDLRALLKRFSGAHAELSADYYHPCTNRAILVRLHNNIKLRLVQEESYAGALTCVERLRLIDPNEYRLYFDSGVLQARLGHKKAAIESFESYLRFATLWSERQDAEVFLRQLRTEMH